MSISNQLEIHPRFLHSNNVANLNVPLSQLLGKEKINLDEVMPKGSSKSVNKALNKMIEPKKKRRKDAKVEEEDTESKTKKSKMDLIMPAPLTTTEAARVERKAIYSKVTEDMNRFGLGLNQNELNLSVSITDGTQLFIPIDMQQPNTTPCK